MAKSTPPATSQSRAKKGSKTKPTAQAQSLKMVSVPLSQLKEDAKNVNSHDEASIEACRRSLEEFGQVEPLVVWKGIVKGGNGRLAAMKLLGWKKCQIVRVDHLSEAKANALAIALNRTAELSAFDDAKLSAMVADLSKSADVDLSSIGFSQDELDELIAGALDVESEEDETGFGVGGGESEPEGNPLFQVIIECRDEQHQVELLERFEAEQLECRALVSER